MGILRKARSLETILARTLDDAAQKVVGTGQREPLEILHAIVDAVEKEVQPAGRGAYVFPFNELQISVVGASREARARFEAVFSASPSLHDRIVERLRAAGSEVRDLSAEVAFVSEAAPGWRNPDFHVEFARVTRAVPLVVASPRTEPRIELAVVAGTADPSAYSFTLDRINLGRCAEVRDHRNRLIRTNHVAFTDQAGGINETVSRRHAHIEYDDSSADYRVYDDRSAHGTGVLRNGRTLPVAPGSRGVRLQSADEIVLGEARVRVELP